MLSFSWFYILGLRGRNRDLVFIFNVPRVNAIARSEGKAQKIGHQLETEPVEFKNQPIGSVHPYICNISSVNKRPFENNEEQFHSLLRMGLFFFMFLSILQGASAADAPAPSLRTAEFGPVTDSEFLKPGQFEWQPELSSEGEVSVNVDLSKQVLEVWRGGVLIARSSVSSGRGQSTPTGTFSILEKSVEHYSNLYNWTPMPYMQRLSWTGIAIHSGNLPGVPASHGCIRIPHTFAKKLYQITARGDTVSIYGNSKDFRPHWARVTRNRVQENFAQGMSASVTVPMAKKLSASGSGPDSAASVRTNPAATEGRKSMRELEIEELRIRNDTELTPSDRMKELKRVWGDQRALMEVATKSQ